MELPKEENVEYHIEIQKCEDGSENGNGEVMYVLDFGGADIPENLAMSIAQWAADRSLEDGNNSFVLQNDSGGEQVSQVMHLESGGDIVDASTGAGCEDPQVIHVKMEDGSDFVMDGSSAGTSGDSIVYNVQNDGSVIHMEKYGLGGRIEQRNLSTPMTNDISSSRVNSGEVRMQNPDVAPRTLAVVNEKNTTSTNSNNNNISINNTYYNNSSNNNTTNIKESDRLLITPFLQGKTPIMLMIGEDGQVSTDVTSIPSIKADLPKVSEKAEGSKSGNTTPANSECTPIILNFQTEKSKIENTIKIVGQIKKNLSTHVTAKADSSSKSLATSLATPEGDDSDVKAGNEPEDNSMDMSVDCSNDNDEKSEEIQIKNEKEENDSMDVESDKPEKPEVVGESAKRVKSCVYEDCEFQSSDPSDYAGHMESKHKDFRPHCCFDCDKRFKLNLTLKIHQLIHMKDARPAKKKRGPYGARDKSYICPLCSHENKYKKDAQLHLKDEHGIETTYTCESCKFICLTQMELDQHNEVVTHRVDNKNYCDICKQLFTNIYQHRAAVHTTDRPFSCTECSYKAKTKSSLRYHMVTHLTAKDWQCPSCPYKCTTERRLKRHLKIHDPNKKHVCNLCSFATHDTYEYKRHHINVHSKPKTYTCKFCEQKFDKHHEIRLHLMFEHDCNDAFFCNHCDFTCSTRASYKEHIQTHYGKHRHVCHICGFTGRYKTHYRRHMLTHSDERPHECTICGKKVSEASNLRRHMLTHSEFKPLACSVCGYRCKIRSRLMNHMKTHSELRPYACHLCKYTTKFNGNLMKHLENHAKYKPHKCQYCSYSCNEKNKLKRHEAFRHKGFVEPTENAEGNNKESEVSGEKSGSALGEVSEVTDNAIPPKDQILLLPNKELVIMQGDCEDRIVLPVDENGLVVASADQADLMAQLESGNVVIAVEDAPSSESFASGEHPDVHQEATMALTNSGDGQASVVVLSTEG